MPFDGMPTITESEAATAIRLIDAVLETLGPKGERWMKCDFSNREGTQAAGRNLIRTMREAGFTQEDGSMLAFHAVALGNRDAGRLSITPQERL